jgi:hypothetical protein
MELPIVRAAAAWAPRLADLGRGRGDVLRPAQLSERELHARAGRFLGLEEDEFVLVRDVKNNPPKDTL